jgi:hypothetical protein
MRKNLANEALCRSCRYPLRGLSASRCPECGLAFDFNRRRTFTLPGEWRAKFSWRRAGLALLWVMLYVGGWEYYAAGAPVAGWRWMVYPGAVGLVRAPNEVLVVCIAAIFVLPVVTAMAVYTIYGHKRFMWLLPPLGLIWWLRGTFLAFEAYASC